MNLTQIEIEQLEIFLANDTLKAVVAKVLNYIIELERPEVRANDTNDVLGEKYRAYELSKQIVRKGFSEINNYTVGKKGKVEENSAI